MIPFEYSVLLRTINNYNIFSTKILINNSISTLELIYYTTKKITIELLNFKLFLFLYYYYCIVVFILMESTLVE